MIKEELEVLNKQIKELERVRLDRSKQYLDDSIREIFNKYPTLENISITVNNHEFNDGEPTYFGVYYEDAELEFNDSDEFSNKTNEDELTDEIQEEITLIFSIVEPTLEEIYSDEFSIYLTRDKYIK